jgi:hypothetical protein
MVALVAACVATLVAVAFALATFERYLARHQPHELAWAIALLMFAVASAALAAGAAVGFSAATYRLFFLFGAVCNVPVLALGTVYLLWGRRVGTAAAIGVGLFCAFAAGVVVTVPFRHALPADVLAKGSTVFSTLPRLLAGVGSGLGAVVIVGGAIYSAVRIRRAC